MWLVKGAPNLMQRLSRLPPVPNVTLLDRRKPKSLSWPHANTTFTQQTYIRWCCIDLSNAPRLPGVEESSSGEGTTSERQRTTLATNDFIQAQGDPCRIP